MTLLEHLWEPLKLVVTLTFGMIAWRWQMLGKRRTEIAEEALVVFARAIDAMADIRNPFGTNAEGLALRKEAGMAADAPLDGEQFHISLWRLRQRTEFFTEIPRLHLLCRYHFGEVADRAFEELSAAVREFSSNAMYGVLTKGGERATADQMQNMFGAIYSIGSSDPIHARMVDAQQRLEALLTPQLRRDAALWPLSWCWR